MFQADFNSSDLWPNLWPALCVDKAVGVEDVEHSLPRYDVDLDAFARATLPETPKIGNEGSHKDLRKKYLFLQAEFSGKPHLTFLLACTIVALRRVPENENVRILFHRILSEHTAQVCTELNLRWLASVCDTLVDCGNSPAQIAIGFAGSALVNTVKLYETERKIYAPPRPWPPNKRFGHGGKLFDGMEAFSAPKGDMIDNLLNRAFTASECDVVAGAVMLEILARLQYRNTVFQRFDQISGNDPLDVLDAQGIEKIKQYLIDQGL